MGVRDAHRVQLEEVVPLPPAVQVEVGVEVVADYDVAGRRPLEREVAQVAGDVAGVERVPDPGAAEVAVAALALVPRAVEVVVDDLEVLGFLGDDRVGAGHLGPDAAHPRVGGPLEDDAVHLAGRVHVAVVVLRVRRIESGNLLGEMQGLDADAEHGVDQRRGLGLVHLAVDRRGTVRGGVHRHVVAHPLVPPQLRQRWEDAFPELAATRRHAA
ncbi:hypothetical protein [Verrucosispora sioxanthis]|uniref:Uncharacterized protein n=1 Tax=Verrucosispora sioxanthis TaxID=2499994 RepID=A0A6M1L3E6_9ACTN|nr:hypothetical protein [Verrucosispora sioxanthis]NEE63290.1 hypothetical protein [Verrucosispora sioxanthis]NGM12400.1 hypothetical protein [Verrucosispora sioxanthis]